MTAIEVKGRDPKIHGKLWAYTELQPRTCGCRKNWQTGPVIWEELRSVATLEVISSYLMRIGMVTRESLREPRYF